jgi:aminoglycoside phosphotransferase (APT) family kinase protein
VISEPSAEELGRDLTALVAGLGSTVERVRHLTRRPSASGLAACYQITLGDGRTVKGRRCRNESAAVRIEAFSRRLPDGHFPAVLARRGAALLIEWIEGRPLTRRQDDGTLVRWAGALLGRIHTVSGLSPERIPKLSPEVERRRLTQALDRLTVVGLTQAESQALVEAATRRVPVQPAVGLVHRDFCPENAVVDPGGRIWFVDIETVGVGAYDYDLARTEYRWPLHFTTRQSFLEGYASYRSDEAFRFHETYWLTLSLVDSALYRLREGIARPEEPVKWLRRMMNGPQAPPSTSSLSPV